jgi:predicted phosphodiesterase
MAHPVTVAALYDIHGNLPALEAVLPQVRAAGATMVVVGGDVLPGPMPAAALDLLRTLDVPVRCLRGNGERETLNAVDGLELTTVPAAYQPPVRWSAAQLDPGHVADLRTWPATVEADLPGIGTVVFCHATLRDDTEIVTRLTPEDRVAPMFAGTAARLVVCGHTHMAFDRRIGGRRVVNAGSVGMPFGPPGAHWLLLDSDGPRFVHTAYDLEAAAARIRATAYPEADVFASNHVLNPPREETMLAAFSG